MESPLQTQAYIDGDRQLQAVGCSVDGAAYLPGIIHAEVTESQFLLLRLDKLFTLGKLALVGIEYCLVLVIPFHYRIN